MHNGYLMAEGEKMSKSLGNFYTIHDLLEEFPGEAIRLALLQTHYRQPLDFTKDNLRQAKHTLDRFYTALRAVAAIAPADAAAGDVIKALEDDINTPLALAALHATLSDLNKAETDAEKARLKGVLLDGGSVLGLLQQDPEEWLRGRVDGGARPERRGDRGAHRAAGRRPQGQGLRRSGPRPRRAGRKRCNP